MNRREFLTQLSATGAAAAVAPFGSEQPRPRSTAAPAERPNILIFMPDQQQGGTVLPGSACQMPNVARFAKEGLLFSQAHCPAPHCCPSRATFQTGLYPSEHGVFNNVDTDTAIHTDPYPDLPYFSKSLADAGYNLAYSGKWHVGRTLRPEHVGWKNLNGAAPTQAAGLGRDHQSAYWDTARQQLAHPKPRGTGEILRPGWGNLQLFGESRVPFEQLKDYRIMQTGIAGMRTLAAQDKPWCVMISNDGGHDPYLCPREFIDKYDWRSIPLPPNFRDRMADKPRIYQRMRRQYWNQMSDDEVRMAIVHYYALLTMQDHLFAQLLHALDETGQADNTLVIYCADHGDYAGAHGLWAKGVPSFREAYNIPCVMRWPRRIQQPGRVLDPLVSTADFAPTILEAAGIKTSRSSGLSLLSWLDSTPPSSWRDCLFTQLNGVELYYTQRIVQTRKHKYVYNGFDEDELYDLQNDPHEMVNLASPGDQTQDATVPWPSLPAALDEVRKDMLARMWQFAREHNDQIFNSYLTVALAPYGPGISRD